jgi:hypothetical protein
MARRLNLSEGLIRRCLDGLREMGLVTFERNEWCYASGEIHLSKDSPRLSLHHNNLRQRAVLNAQTPLLNGMHVRSGFYGARFWWFQWDRARLLLFVFSF